MQNAALRKRAATRHPLLALGKKCRTVATSAGNRGGLALRAKHRQL